MKDLCHVCVCLVTDEGGEDPEVLVDVDIEEGEIEDHHDSHMISQLISETDDDDIEHGQSMYQFLISTEQNY